MVPKRRFPEFRGSGDWTTAKLGEVASLSTEKVGNADCVPMSITSGVGLVSQEDKFGRVIAGQSYKNYLLLKPNDFAYNKSATKEYPEGFLALYPGSKLGAVPNSIFTCFRVNAEAVVPAYLKYLFIGNLHGQWLRNFIQIGARAHGSLSVNDSDLMALPVPLPAGAASINEQQKVADCLSSLDELIAIQARKVDMLKAHKNGLMHRLFPCESETQPRLRFPEFQSGLEWISSTIAQLVDDDWLYPPRDGNHGNIHPKSSDYVANGIPFIMASDLKDGKINTSGCHFISKEQADSLQKGFSKEGDVLLSHKGTVGAVAIVPSISTPYLMLTPQVTYYRVKSKAKLSNTFLAQLFTSPVFQKNLLIASGGGTRSYIGIIEQAKLPVRLPSDFKEQQRIAEFLTCLDEQITAQRQQLETLRAHKNGLMQQLFPLAKALEA